MNAPPLWRGVYVLLYKIAIIKKDKNGGF